MTMRGRFVGRFARRCMDGPPTTGGPRWRSETFDSARTATVGVTLLLCFPLRRGLALERGGEEEALEDRFGARVVIVVRVEPPLRRDREEVARGVDALERFLRHLQRFGERAFVRDRLR